MIFCSEFSQTHRTFLQQSSSVIPSAFQIGALHSGFLLPVPVVQGLEGKHRAHTAWSWWQSRWHIPQKECAPPRDPPTRMRSCRPFPSACHGRVRIPPAAYIVIEHGPALRRIAGTHVVPATAATGPALCTPPGVAPAPGGSAPHLYFSPGRYERGVKAVLIYPVAHRVSRQRCRFVLPSWRFVIPSL